MSSSYQVTNRKVLAIIPARGGSKGIARKNLAPCGGRPLVDWTIAAVNDSIRITEAVLSSDDDEILARAEGRVQPLRRPEELARDETATEPVIAHALEGRRPDLVVLLQPTSPLRTGRDIDLAIQHLEFTGSDSVASVVDSHTLLWHCDGPDYDPQNRPRRQELKWRQYEENGAIYVFTYMQWLRTGCRLGGRARPYPMAEEHRLQVDTPLDLELVSELLDRQAVPA